MRKVLIGMIAFMSIFGFTACDSSDNEGGSDRPELPTDTLWYEVTNQHVFTPNEFVDSLCRVEPDAKDRLALIKTFIPANTRIRVVDFLYNSSDAKGGIAQLSAQVIIPVRNNTIAKKALMIDNRATQIADADVPTNRLNIGSLLSLIGAPVVTADLLGYGATENLPISYNCYHTAAVNTVDAALVAQQMLHSRWLGLGLGRTPLPVFSEGYSQGGYDALAVQRYLETQANDDVKKQLPLQRTWCGAGAYDQRIFLDTVLRWEDYRYSPYIVAAFISCMNYHPEVFPADFQISDVLTDRVRESNIIDMINSKQYGDGPIKDYISKQLDGDVSLSNLFVEDLINPDGYLHGLCLAMAEKENVLSGWKPTIPIDFFHATNDDCVPVQCTYAAMEAFKDCKNVSFEEHPAEPEPGLHSKSYVKFILNIMMGEW